MPHSDDYPQSRWEQENQISPSAPLRVPGGIRLHTLWGRLAYQLGGNDGYDIVRTDDLAGTSPGAALKTLFGRFGPAVVLIDEWVAYARQLRDGSNNEGQRSDGGDFDTQFTFAQALTEAAAAVPDVVVLISIPASDVEVGGPRGKTALEKLKNVVARKAAQWQPASPDESFEIVRRRAARTVYMGSAPRPDGRRGVDEPQATKASTSQPGAPSQRTPTAWEPNPPSSSSRHSRARLIACRPGW